MRDFDVVVASLIAAAVAFTELARTKHDETRARHVLTLPGLPLRCISDSNKGLHQLEIDVARDCLQVDSCAATVNRYRTRRSSAL